MQTRRAGPRQEVPEEFAEQLRSWLDTDVMLLNALLVASRDKGWSAPALADALQMNAPAVSKRVERARQRADDPDLQRRLGAITIPLPERVMLDGRSLPAADIAKLRNMQEIASRINGASVAGSDERRVSEELAAELNELVNHQGYSPYYLAGVMEISHRAVTSRLERHGFRKPPPSVAGTSSGVYHGRRIGDPGQGAPRLTTEQREALRSAWAIYRRDTAAQNLRLLARTQLRELLIPRLAEGFTLANLAQAISTKDHKVRYPQLRLVLEETNWSGPDDD